MSVFTEKNFIERIYPEAKRLPNKVVYMALALCTFPFLLNIAGFQFEFGGPLQEIFHIVMEWSAFCVAMLTCVLAFAHYSAKRDPVTPIIGLMLFCIGMFDAYHILVSARVIVANSQYQDIVAFSWTASRLFSGFVGFIAIGVFLTNIGVVRRKNLSLLRIVGISLFASSLVVCILCTASPIMPKNYFPGQIMTRPWDTLPLFIFFFRAYVFYLFYSRYPSPFSFALFLSTAPDILSQVYMAYGDSVPYGNAYNVAHLLKLLAYSFPFFGLCFDYVSSHRKMASVQKKLRHSVERFDLAVAGSSDGLWDWDLVSGKTYMGPRFKEIVGIESPENAESFDTFISHLEDASRELVQKKLKDHLLHKIPFDSECQAVTKDKSLRWLRIRGQALWNSKGVAKRISGSISDIHEVKTTQLEIEEERHRAEAASKAKSEFVANMSHEIRTPMNAIIGMADLLEQTALDEVQKRYVETLKRSGDSLLNLINDILDFSKIEAGQLPLKNEPFSVEGVMDRVGEMLSIPAQKKKIDLVFHVDPHMPSSFIGDPFRLRQVLLNLVGNAIKFTLEGGMISVHATASFLAGRDYELAFSVKDTGIGISEEFQEKIFESFTQAENNISEEYGGTGLGLAICSRIISLMGGKIRVESRLGEGSTFFFNVHLKIDEKMMPMLEPISIDLRGRRVLVVDDIPVNRMILRETLSSCGSVVDEDSSGEEAYQRLLAGAKSGVTFDLAILDGRMPGLDGYELARKIREQRLPVESMLMLTSDDRPQQIERLRSVSVENYLVKPLRRSELLEAMQRIFVHKKEAVTEQPALSKQFEKSMKILLVDDNPDNRMLVLSYLKEYPMQIDVADDGTTALDKFVQNQYDLVIMDVRMKIMNGYEATKRIREWEAKKGRARTPVLALTAYAMRKDVDEAQLAGCDGHLSKPIRRKQLLDEVHRVMGSSVETIEPVKETVSEFSVDRELVAKIQDLIPDFLKNREQDLERLKDAISVNDFETIETIGHNMAGTAPGYGFPELGRIGEHLEDAAEGKDTEKIKVALARFENTVASIRHEVAA